MTAHQISLSKSPIKEASPNLRLYTRRIAFTVDTVLREREKEAGQRELKLF
jgi:hypothetical protein